MTEILIMYEQKVLQDSMQDCEKLSSSHELVELPLAAITRSICNCMCMSLYNVSFFIIEVCLSTSFESHWGHCIDLDHAVRDLLLCLGYLSCCMTQVRPSLGFLQNVALCITTDYLHYQKSCGLVKCNIINLSYTAIVDCWFNDCKVPSSGGCKTHHTCLVIF